MRSPDWLASWRQKEPILSPFCERKHIDEYLIEDANALSNLGFVILGEFVCSIYLYDIFHAPKKESILENNEHNIIIQFPIWTLIHGLTMMYLGIASYLFHGSLTFTTHALDVASIYAPFLYIVFLVIMNYVYFLGIQHMKWIKKDSKRNLNIINYILVFMLLILNIICIIIRNHLSSYEVVATFIIILFLIILVLTIVWFIICWNHLKDRKRCIKLLILGVLLLMGGFGIRELDAIICFPDSFFQIHALFHVLISIGLLVVYFMARSNTFILDKIWIKNDNGMMEVNSTSIQIIDTATT